jgi:hypothetical protein
MNAPPLADAPSRGRSLGLILHLTGAAFLTYFCMYAFRKPFNAAKYEGLDFLGTGETLKTALIQGQVIGYAASKFLGIKWCSEVDRASRWRLLLGCIAVAQAALVLFAVVPGPWKVLAIFINGLPLGMVWGFVVAYLEGRRTSEVLLAGLSCSYIVSSGAVKDVGVELLHNGVSESWMPAAVGGLFLLPFVLGVWLLELAPAPSAEDVRARVERPPMRSAERWQFIREFWPGLVGLLVVFFFLTAFRDYRDSFGRELYDSLGYKDDPGIFTRSELRVALGVMPLLILLYLVRDNRRAMSAAFGLMTGGFLLIGLSTWLFQQGHVDGFLWMVLIGFGCYLAYVPFGSMLFDRQIAATRFVGTAVFAIYLADAIGYLGSVVMLFFKDRILPKMTRLEFMQAFCMMLSVGGAALLAASWGYFHYRAVPPAHPAVDRSRHFDQEERTPVGYRAGCQLPDDDLLGR